MNTSLIEKLRIDAWNSKCKKSPIRTFHTRGKKHLYEVRRRLDKKFYFKQHHLAEYLSDEFNVKISVALLNSLIYKNDVEHIRKVSYDKITDALLNLEQYLVNNKMQNIQNLNGASKALRLQSYIIKNDVNVKQLIKDLKELE